MLQLETRRDRGLATAGGLVFFLLLAAAPGCGDEGDGGGCSDLCAKEDECRSDIDAIPFDETGCVTQCEALSADDPSYAEAIEVRADCYAETTCDEVLFGFACRVSGE